MADNGQVGPGRRRKGKGKKGKKGKKGNGATNDPPAVHARQQQQKKGSNNRRGGHQGQRARLREIGTETVRIVRNKKYRHVDMTDLIDAAVENSVFYDPDDHPEDGDIGEVLEAMRARRMTVDVAVGGGDDDDGSAVDADGELPPTRVEVRNETVLDAVRRLEDRFGFAGNVCVLNFASAKNPGGGYATGAQAQEESIARASALVECICRNPGFAYNRSHKSFVYTDHCTYSPLVPVFRDTNEDLVGSLEEVRLVSFVSSAAPNRGHMRKNASNLATEALERRIDRTLALMARGGHTAIVLGAFGCGVFKNDPYEVAFIFGEALREKYRGVFDHVVFANYSRKGINVSEFVEELEDLIAASQQAHGVADDATA